MITKFSKKICKILQNGYKPQTLKPFTTMGTMLFSKRSFFNKRGSARKNNNYE